VKRQREERRAIMAERRRELFFNDAQNTCDESSVAYIPLLNKRIRSVTNVAHTLQQLQAGKLPREQKVLLWEQLKLQAFTQTIASTYALCLLGLYIRIQVNIVSRYVFLDKVIPFFLFFFLFVHRKFLNFLFVFSVSYLSSKMTLLPLSLSFVVGPFSDVVNR